MATSLDHPHPAGNGEAANQPADGPTPGEHDRPAALADVTDARAPRSKDAFRPPQEFESRVLAAIPDAVIVTDNDFRIRLMNHSAEVMFNARPRDVLGQIASDMITTDHGSADRERAAWVALSDGTQWSGRVRQRGMGDWHEVWLTTVAIRSASGKIEGRLFVSHEIAALKEAEQAATDRSDFAAAVLESLPGRTCVVNREGMVIATNQRYRLEGPAGAGEATGPVEGQNYLAWAADAIDEDSAFALGELLEGERPDFRTEFVAVRRRRRRWTELDAIPLEIEAGGAVITHLDITNRKQAETNLHKRATHDALTGLPNRVLLADRLAHALARSARTGGHVGVLFCDLDGFREVNNKHGHLAGDRLLVTVAKRLRAVCRSSDTVARVSGDEFVVVLEDVTGEGEVEEVARRVIDALTEPVVLEEGTARTGTSIGLVISQGTPRAGMRAVEALIRDADSAMYAAKEAGRARFAWFTPEMRERPRERPTFARAIGRLLRG